MRGGLVVSVQAAPGSPLAAPEHLAAIARAVEAGGAVGIRTEGVDGDPRDQGGCGRAGDRPRQAPHARHRGLHHARRSRTRWRWPRRAPTSWPWTPRSGRGRTGRADAEFVAAAGAELPGQDPGRRGHGERRAARRPRPAPPRSRRRCPATPATDDAGRAGHSLWSRSWPGSLTSRCWPRGDTARRRRSGPPSGRVPSRWWWAPRSRIRKSSRAGSRAAPPLGADG